MPNENISCASTGNSAQPVSTLKDRKPLRIRASLFYDGTCSNSTDTEARGDDPFENGETNVARLERMLLRDRKNNPQFDATFSIYTGGIGNLESDAVPATPASRSIAAKVAQGIKALYRNILNINAPDRLIELIAIDTFGFSHGAAAARNAIHVILNDERLRLKGQLEVAGYTVQQVEIRFVGLFDTVSHQGAGTSDDVDGLHLDAISSAQQVVQLAAADEYRHDFPLISIRSKGTEIELPGVHSDVGGSYRATLHEKDLRVLKRQGLPSGPEVRSRFEREKPWLIEEGWFQDVPEEIGEIGSEFILNRFDILNTYGYIPLDIMRNHAGQSALKFNELRMESFLRLVDASVDLRQLRALLGPLGGGAWRSNKDLMRRVRHKYCHFNALYSFIGVNDPDWSDGDPVTGVRKRTVIHG